MTEHSAVPPSKLVVGVLFGIKMIFTGWALVFIGRIVKRAATSFEA